jgi:hypothetical protein
MDAPYARLIMIFIPFLNPADRKSVSRLFPKKRRKHAEISGFTPLRPR